MGLWLAWTVVLGAIAIVTADTLDMLVWSSAFYLAGSAATVAAVRSR